MSKTALSTTIGSLLCDGKIESLNDELGKLKVDDAGLIKRDEIVLQFFKSLSIPIATVIGGGYSKNKIELAKRHASIFKAAKNIFLED